MKATAQVLVSGSRAEKGRWAVLSELVKIRLTFLVLLTTLAGFYLGSGRNVSWSLMLHTLAGTFLLAGGAAALNQLLEREYDGRMLRTRDRPLPSGRIGPASVAWIGVGSIALGVAYLAVVAHWTTAGLGLLTTVLYLGVYTPLKRITPLNTLVGAIPGAMPPLIGWSAAQGGITAPGWSLFGILALWQVPHFLAIAWIYREDYERGGFVMLPAVDQSGRKTGHCALVFAALLLVVSLLPVWYHLVGSLYMAGALVLGGGFTFQAYRFALGVSLDRARGLFYASIVYLPLMLGLMAADKAG
jgi:heme o synthase